jgi:hypothetical protein
MTEKEDRDINNAIEEYLIYYVKIFLEIDSGLAQEVNNRNFPDMAVFLDKKSIKNRSIEVLENRLIGPIRKSSKTFKLGKENYTVTSLETLRAIGFKNKHIKEMFKRVAPLIQKIEKSIKGLSNKIASYDVEQIEQSLKDKVKNFIIQDGNKSNYYSFLKKSGIPFKEGDLQTPKNVMVTNIMSKRTRGQFSLSFFNDLSTIEFSNWDDLRNFYDRIEGNNIL